MGVVLERSKIAEVLLTTMGQLFGSLRGGLGLSVVVVGALLAASTGVVGATVVAIGLLALPAMMRAGHDPRLATGVICAAGTLGQIVPPSTVLIFTADILQGANAAAQLSLGNFAPDTVSVGDLFAGAFIPGVGLAIVYGLWVLGRAALDPKAAPALPMSVEERAGLARRVVIAACLVPVVATPVLRRAFGETLFESSKGTMTITSMVFVILLGASAFALVFTRMGGDTLVQGLLANMPGGQVGAVMLVMGIMFILGFFLDTFEIIFITVPITAPILIMMGVDPILLGVLIGLVLQTSFLTPPFGFSLFYLRGVAPPSITTGMIYRGIVPFVVLQLVVLGLVWSQPYLATALPNYLFRTAQQSGAGVPPPPLFDAEIPESDGG